MAVTWAPRWGTGGGVGEQLGPSSDELEPVYRASREALLTELLDTELPPEGVALWPPVGREWRSCAGQLQGRPPSPVPHPPHHGTCHLPPSPGLPPARSHHSLRPPGPHGHGASPVGVVWWVLPGGAVPGPGRTEVGWGRLPTGPRSGPHRQPEVALGALVQIHGPHPRLLGSSHHVHGRGLGLPQGPQSWAGCAAQTPSDTPCWAAGQQWHPDRGH